MRAPIIRFAVLLPIAELVLWIVLVPTQGLIAWLNLRHAARGARAVQMSFGEFTVVIPRDQFLRFAFGSATRNESPFITALNVPGMFAEFPLSAALSWPEVWRPRSLTPDLWRCISLPVFCLPAWWFAGRGLDSLLGWRRPRWWTLLIGTLLSVGFLVLLFGLWYGGSRADLIDGYWLLWGMGFWALALSLFPVVWIRNAVGFAAAGRPSKRDRRRIHRFRDEA